MKYKEMILNKEVYMIQEPMLIPKKVSIVEKGNGTYTYKDDQGENCYCCKYLGRYQDEDNIINMHLTLESAKEYAFKILENRFNRL